LSAGAEAPAPKEKKHPKNLNNFVSEQKNARVTVSRAETRKSGENYSRIEIGVERGVDKSIPDTIDETLLTIEAKLDDALNANRILDDAHKEPTKPTETEDPYINLPWKQSVNNVRLKTILVEPPLLADPTAKKLYDVCKLADKTGVRVGRVTYRYSLYHDREYLQRWGR
jgi:hypothetical protein